MRVVPRERRPLPTRMKPLGAIVAAAVMRWLLCGTALLFVAARGESADAPASPEMARLARVLAGDWNTEEIGRAHV